MRIGAAEAEGADHCRTSALRVLRPRLQCGVDHERTVGQIDVRIEAFEAGRGRQLAVFQRQHQLERAGDAGRVEGVADVALHRAQRAVAGLVGVVAEGLGEAFHFDRIAQLRARAVRFDQLDVFRIDPEAVVDGAHQARLRHRIRRGDAVGLAVLVDAPAADHRVDDVAVALGVGKPLQHQRAHAFAGHEAVRAMIEGEAAAVGRQHAGLTGLDVHHRARHHRHTTGEREVAVVGDQTVAGVGDRDQRGGARGVDRQARALQVEEVGDARGENRHRRAGEALGAVLVFARALVVVGRTAADEHAAAAARQAARVDRRVLDRMPAALQHQPLLRVHDFGFGRRDVEEQRVESVAVFQHAHPAAVGGAGNGNVVAEIALDVPALRRHRIDAVLRGGDVAPERVERFGARELSRDADHGDGIVGDAAGRGAAPRAGRAPRGQTPCMGGSMRPGRRCRVEAMCRCRPERGGRGVLAGSRPRGQRSTQETTELDQRRMAVDLGRFDAGAVERIDLAHPCHAGDRIQTQFDELPVLVDIGLRHVQFLREQTLEVRAEIGFGCDGLRTHGFDICGCVICSCNAGRGRGL